MNITFTDNKEIKDFIEKYANLMQPDDIVLIDGSKNKQEN